MPTRACRESDQAGAAVSTARGARRLPCATVRRMSTQSRILDRSAKAMSLAARGKALDVFNHDRYLAELQSLLSGIV